MKKLNIVFRLSFSFIISTAFLSCGSTNVTPSAEQEPEKPVNTETPAEPVPAQENTPAETAGLMEEPAVISDTDDEYSRSVGDIQISRDTFIDDKEKILQIIKDLDSIMKNMNYNSWLSYVEPESIDYWKLRKNLQKYEKHLPIKGIKLRDLQDYFKHVFVPSRKGREVTEIRYISDTYIKAVQVRDNQGDLIYYYFNKINGKWMVHLPTNEEMN
ncbi:hypothetical protein [Treponema sp.]|uniref:hypothetical protein n=1 Tax=Treponema sp. TaxID=166 RepID=UPI00388E3519